MIMKIFLKLSVKSYLCKVYTVHIKNKIMILLLLCSILLFSKGMNRDLKLHLMAFFFIKNHYIPVKQLSGFEK